MPKKMTVNPSDVRKPASLDFQSIDINSYRPEISRERKKYGDDQLIAVYRIMAIIREFESALNSIKINKRYRDLEYDHRGPAHLSIGEEAVAVGLCATLSTDDFVFGSHRSHGEILAKCLSAIRKLPEDDLHDIMRRYQDGDILRIVEEGHKGSLRDLAERFVVYGTLAEIFGRFNGCNRGMGGSMHAFFAPFGSMPNNAIVGGSADIALGSALFKRINRRPGIVMANIGDASMGCGPVWEAMVLASMDQYRTLWDREIGGAPPVMFNIINNFYGMGGQTQGETMGQGIMARIGAGINPEQMHAERVDGYNPLAVIDAVERKGKLLREGKGPVLLDIITYRISGHSPSDASSYRTREEIDQWKEHDCLHDYGSYLLKNKVCTEEMLEEIQADVLRLIQDSLIPAISLERSPRPTAGDIESFMFSNEQIDCFDDRKPELLLDPDENPRVKALAKRGRSARDEQGRELPLAERVSYRDALFEAMLHRFSADPTMVAFGEENRDWGGAFAVYRGLTESLPYHRLFNASISEGGIVGAGVGYALSGGRAVVELMYCDFMGRAGDELFNQMAKWQAMSAGLLKMPLVLRVSVGSKYGAQHSQDWSGLAAHIPGLKAMYPATPHDCKGMLNAALHGSDPVIFFESQKLYNIAEEFVAGGVPRGYYEIPEGLPVLRRRGEDITILTLGPALYTALDAAERLRQDWQLSAEVIDLRFINPLNYTLILESLHRTGLVLLVTEAVERGSAMQTVAATISQIAFDDLDGPPVIVGARNWITPAAEMEDLFFPQTSWLLDAIHHQLRPLPGYQPFGLYSSEELRRRSSAGV